LKSICIVGRVNVGKSTLFNRLIQDWAAIVEDTPGVTRDRKEGILRIGERKFCLVDTGGLDPEIEGDPAKAAQLQARIAIDIADLIIFVVDVRTGLLAGDHEIADLLRPMKKPVLVVANKTDHDGLLNELFVFVRLGLGDPIPVAAEHKLGLEILEQKIVEMLPSDEFSEGIDADDANETAVAIVGRANVGKSSLVNALLGYDRHIVTANPGTTRDSVDSIYSYNNQNYRLIDTAGIRKLGRTKDKIDKISTIMARKSIERCQVAVLVFDACEGITAQDLHVGGYIVESGRGLILAANKWDLTPRTIDFYESLKKDLDRKASFISWAPIVTISAISKQRVFKLFAIIDKVMAQLLHEIPTTDLNRLIQSAQKRHNAPRRKNYKPLKFYYATQISHFPPTFLIFTNTIDNIHFSYKRFISNQIRKEFGFFGCPIKLVFRHKRD
jgi:GTPase